MNLIKYYNQDGRFIFIDCGIYQSALADAVALSIGFVPFSKATNGFRTHARKHKLDRPTKRTTIDLASKIKVSKGSLSWERSELLAALKGDPSLLDSIRRTFPSAFGGTDSSDSGRSAEESRNPASGGDEEGKQEKRIEVVEGSYSSRSVEADGNS